MKQKFDVKVKIQELKLRLYWRFQQFKNWFVRNKEMIFFLTPFIAGAGKLIFKFVGKRTNLRKEENLKNLYCYDRSLGHYWRLRRELTNKEWLEIDRRKKNGERLADILDELKVLK